MELNVIFTSDENVVYYFNDFYVKTTKGTNINDLLLEYQKAVLSKSDDVNDYFFDHDNKIICSLLGIASFDSMCVIIADDFTDFESIKPFFEMTNKQLTLNVNSLSEEALNILKDIKYQKEPFIESKYNIYENVKLSEYLKTCDCLKKMVSTIEYYNFSEIEKLMFLYDLLKKRSYKDNDKSISNARDLSKVLQNEEIVCAGFANAFCACANVLGIKSVVKIYINDNDSKLGHASCASYINDAKYGIHACYEFDITCDCKNETNKKNSYKYNGFAVAPAIFSKYNKNRNYTVTSNFDYYFLKQKYENYLETKKFLSGSEILRKSINNYLKSYLKYARKMSIVIGNEVLMEEINQYLDDLAVDISVPDEKITEVNEKITKIYTKSLSSFNFAKCLYSVRRVEHYLDSQEYPLSAEEIHFIYKNKLGEVSTRLIEILGYDSNEIFDYCNIETYRDIDNYEEDLIDLDSKRMELIGTLKRIKKDN